MRRKIGTSRERDFYDLHMLYLGRKDTVRMEIFRRAVLHTAEKRGSLDDVRDWKEILKDIREEPVMYLLWDRYIADNPYIGGLEFHEVLDTVDEIAALLDFYGVVIFWYRRPVRDGAGCSNYVYATD